MSEWGSYLKKAVANVEQQLDKVLLDSSETGSKYEDSTKRDTKLELSERLKLAAQGKSQTAPNSIQSDTLESSLNSNEINTSKAEEELIVLENFEIAPDLSLVLLEARKLALVVQRDDILKLVELLETVDNQLSKYVDNVAERLGSLHSKLRLLSSQGIDSKQGQQKQLALLMEEGQRLSQQELKLGLLVKKLRSERTSASSRADTAIGKQNAAEAQIVSLLSELEVKKSSLKELEGIVEHFRVNADENLEKVHLNGNPQDLEDKFNAEKVKWSIMETELLARINDLEHLLESKDEKLQRVTYSLNEQKQLSKECRDNVANLEEKLLSTIDSNTINSSRLEGEISEVKLKYESLLSENAELQLRNEQLEQLVNENSKASLYDSSFAYEEYSMDPVGPTGPFGENEYPIPKRDDTGEITVSDMADNSLRTQDDNVIGSRRASSQMGNEFLGGNLSLVKRLSLKVSKLKNEVEVERKAFEVACQERDELQSEIEKIVDTQNELQQIRDANLKLSEDSVALDRKVIKLESMVADKDERISELEQDVRDLKEMYRDQIEALVAEIEKSRK